MLHQIVAHYNEPLVKATN